MMDHDKNKQQLILGVNMDLTERERAEEALRQSEHRQRAILDTIPDPAWLKDKDGRFITVNAAWCRFFGLDAETVLGKTAVAFLPAEVAAKFEEQDHGIMRSRQPLHCEELLTDKDGRLVWFETIKTPLYDDHGEVVGTSGLARDITERKIQEREIERLNRLYAALSELNQIIVRVKSREELLREVCRITTEKAGFQFAWIGCLEIETRRVIPIASTGSEQDYLDEIEVYADDRPEGRGPCGRCIRNNAVCVVNDFERDFSTAPWHTAAAKHGFRTSAALPIRFQGKVWGVLMAYDGEPDVIQDKEIALLEDASAAISLALDRLDRESQREQADEALRESEEKFRNLFNNAEVGMFRNRFDGSAMLDLNDKYLFILGRSREETVGKPSVVLWADPKDREEMSTTLKAKGHVDGLECRMIKKDGTIINCITSLRLYPEQGIIEGSIIDITERKRLEHSNSR